MNTGAFGLPSEGGATVGEELALGLTGASTLPGASFRVVMRELRDRQRLTQEGLAELLAQSPSYVSLLESGKRRPTRRVVSGLCEALKLSPEDEARLTAAAGFPVDELDQAIEHVVDLIMASAPDADLERETARADLTAAAETWRELIAGKRFITSGRFLDAREHFERLRDRKQVSLTLKAMILAGVADTSEKRGELHRARKAIDSATKVVRKFPDGWALPLQAEIDAIEAMLEIRLGHYPEARALIKRSKDLYGKVERNTEKPSSLAVLGLAKSHIRQAFLAMLEGKPEAALSACDMAEEQVDRVTDSERDRRRLRIWGIRAWAYSKMPDHFDDARQLHKRVLDVFKALNDCYGIAKQLLYLGDDCRQMIEAHIPEDVDDADYRERRERLVACLEPHQALIDEAENFYRRAKEEFEKTQEGIMLSRALRSLGEVVRLQNLLRPTKETYQEALRLLNGALSLESEVGQGRRIPLTYESLAKLEWDKGALASAEMYYTEAINQLDNVVLEDTDVAGKLLRKRCQRACDVLLQVSALARRQSAANDVSDVAQSDTHSATLWRHARERLVRVVKQALVDAKLEPFATSDLDPRWIGLLRDMETCESGRRLIVQGQLSASLSMSLRAGFPAGEAAVHAERVERMRQNVVAANTNDGLGAYHDLCCRNQVEGAFRDGYTRTLCEGRVNGALEILKQCPRGYHLDASAYDVPFGFALKGNRIYLEIPIGLAWTVGLTKEELVPGSVLCYTTNDNSQLLHDLDAMFFELVKLSRASTELLEDTESWLKRLITPHDSHARRANVGAM